jgi:putative regulatory protein, fmdB family
MPIYAYKCSHCGFAKDVLQKMSDAPLKVCPSCGQPAFAKQVTAAGFQLKGSGWYVTDFRNEGKTGASSAPASDAPSSGAAAGASAGTSGDAAAASSAAASPGSAAAAD